MEKEWASYHDYYPFESYEVFSPRWYYKGYDDEYSKKILSSKKVDESEYFKPELKKLINTLKAKGLLKGYDLITIFPKSNLKYSPTLETLGGWIADYLKIKYEKIIIRKKTGRRNEGKDYAEKRYNKTKNSMSLKKGINLKGKSIILFDDVKATGMTILECGKILKNIDIKNIQPICLGISRNPKKFPPKK